MDRRKFLKHTAIVSAGVAVQTAGCSSSMRAIIMEMPARGEWITVIYTDYKELEEIGGAIQIHVEDKNESIILMRSSEGRFHALSPICTHLGCEVKAVKTGFRCPCHGSAYGEEGQAVNGPAREDLASYQIAQKGRQISIRVM